MKIRNVIHQHEGNTHDRIELLEKAVMELQKIIMFKEKKKQKNKE